MPAPTRISFARRPSMVPAYARVLLGKKPYSAPEGTVIEPVELEVRRLMLSEAHIRRYRDVCAVPSSVVGLPPAYLHLLAMPLHMQLFVVKNFPVKVLGLIHLRNTIRVLQPVDVKTPLRMLVKFSTLRLTDIGQEYDFTTTFEQNGVVVWEELSTMFARGNAPPKEGVSRRPVIERSNHPETGVHTETLEVGPKTGWRYARVSGDFNPIHLTARTAQMFGFKQSVAHGMWSMGRCLSSAAALFPNMKIQIDTQFKLPVYIPSQALAYSWNVEGGGADISMCMMKGDRLHLAMQVRPL